LFFGIASLVFFLAAGVLAVPIFVEYYATGLVPRFPTAILVTSITLLGFLSLACGLILDTVSRGRREVKRLQYLQVGAAERRQQPLG
jgi:hypothetical protein